MGQHTSMPLTFGGIFLAEEWKSRAQRREEARQLAKLLIRGAPKPKQSRWDITLACLVGVMAILLIIAPPQSWPTMLAWLVATFGLGVYPAFHFAQWLPMASKRTAKVIGVAGLAAIIAGLGYGKWPLIRRHVLDKTERLSFENALKLQRDPDLDIQIGCPADDEQACIYAEQFVSRSGNLGGGSSP